MKEQLNNSRILDDGEVPTDPRIGKQAEVMIMTSKGKLSLREAIIPAAELVRKIEEVKGARGIQKWID